MKSRTTQLICTPVVFKDGDIVGALCHNRAFLEKIFLEAMPGIQEILIPIDFATEGEYL